MQSECKLPVMSDKIQTQFGEPVPPASRHSVTVHMGDWDNVERYGNNSSSVIAQFKNVYPRMRPHPYIVEVRLTSVNLDFKTSLLNYPLVN